MGRRPSALRWEEDHLPLNEKKTFCSVMRRRSALLLEKDFLLFYEKKTFCASSRSRHSAILWVDLLLCFEIFLSFMHKFSCPLGWDILVVNERPFCSSVKRSFRLHGEVLSIITEITSFHSKTFSCCSSLRRYLPIQLFFDNAFCSSMNTIFYLSIFLFSFKTRSYWETLYSRVKRILSSFMWRVV